MNKIDMVTTSHDEFLKFLKSQFPLFHKSNVFLRDLQYGVMEYFQKEKKAKVKYVEAEVIARKFAEFLEKKDILRKLDSKTWMLNYPEFTKKAS
jgi:ABC-type thiamine transport system substrate-binding protein